MGESPLSNYRVLDLADEKGLFAGKILADLGMDVIKVEKPGGDPARNRGPFFKDIPHPEKSLFWFAFNTNKRGITLNIESEDGKEIFLKLVKRADIIIESFPPGYMERIGLGYPQLKGVNPRIIFVSISGFGQSGPYKDFKAPDIVVMAMSGVMNLIGDSNRHPLRIGIPQAYLHAGAEAAVGVLIALWHREITGIGQWVDVSAQESVTWEGVYNQASWDLIKVNIGRQGAYRMLGKVKFRQLFPCKDGYVIYLMYGGLIGAQSQQALVNWMDEEGMANDFLKSFNWDTFEPATLNEEQAKQLEGYFLKFFATKTKKELFERALNEGLLLAPVNSIEEVVNTPHFKERGFWVEIEHPELGVNLPYPGAPYISERTPYQVRRRAPLIGEHNEEIYIGELNFSREEIVMLKTAGVI